MSADEPLAVANREDVAEEMDPEAEEMEMTYEQQRLATIRYVSFPYRRHWLISRRANEELLKSLGLVTNPPPPPPRAQPAAQSSRAGSAEVKRPVKRPKKEQTPTEPLRKSSRLAVVKAAEEKKRRKKRPKLERNQSSLTPLDGDESEYETDTSAQSGSSDVGVSGKRKTAVLLPPGEKIRIPVPRSIEYDDAEEEDDYSKVQPVPTRDARGRLVFEGRWKGVFVPNLTPEQVLRGGAFGGTYYA